MLRYCFILLTAGIGVSCVTGNQLTVGPTEQKPHPIQGESRSLWDSTPNIELSSQKVKLDGHSRELLESRQLETRYLPLLGPSDDGSGEVLEIEHDRRDVHSFEGGYRGELKVQRIQVIKNNRADQLWKLRDYASTYAVKEDAKVFETMLAGCCGGVDSGRYYSLETGELLFPGRYQIVSTPESDAKQHLLGFQGSHFPARDQAKIDNLPKDKTLACWMFWGTSHKVLQRFAVIGSEPDDFYPPDEIEIMDTNGISTPLSQGVLVENGSLRLTWTGNKKEIIIPFRHGLLNFKTAILSNGYSIQSLSQQDIEKFLELDLGLKN